MNSNIAKNEITISRKKDNSLCEFDRLSDETIHDLIKLGNVFQSIRTRLLKEGTLFIDKKIISKEGKILYEKEINRF